MIGFYQRYNHYKLYPKSVLEIGCSNGYRLQKLHKTYSCSCYEIDPSDNAIKDGQKQYPTLNLYKGDATKLPFTDKKFDMVIFGFCLYLCDREDLFKIAYEADRVLKKNGHIVIYDFFHGYAVL